MPLTGPEVVGLIVGGGGEGGEGGRGLLAGRGVTPAQRLDVFAHRRPRPLF